MDALLNVVSTYCNKYNNVKQHVRKHFYCCHLPNCVNVWIFYLTICDTLSAEARQAEKGAIAGANGKTDWTKMITDLENFGRMEISSIISDLATPNQQPRPSTSSPHDSKLNIPSPGLPVGSQSFKIQRNPENPIF